MMQHGDLDQDRVLYVSIAADNTLFQPKSIDIFSFFSTKTYVVIFICNTLLRCI